MTEEESFVCCTPPLQYRAIDTSPGRYAAKEFLLELTPAALKQFHAAARIYATSVESGRPPGGRVERVEGSRPVLMELKITPPGSRGPQARLLFVREGNIVWLARGVIKRERLPHREIKAAEQTVREFRARRRTG